MKKIETFVRDIMNRYDASHDWYHVCRVRRLSLKIAEMEGIMDVNVLKMIELCALLHDVNDRKYVDKTRKDGNIDDIRKLLVGCGISNDGIERIFNVCEYVSFSKENKMKLKGGKEYEAYLKVFEDNVELRIVSDADRLDAIGAVGIARTFTFGGCFGRKMFNYIPDNNDCGINDDECKESGNDVMNWIQNDNECKKTTLYHFYEKLFLLKDMMKTESGKKLANKRHDIMKAYVDQFLLEWNGDI